jgi:preprotein translocase subunit SecF
MQIVKPDININFVGRRKIAYIFSLAIILASVFSLILHGGPKYGIDFAGGAEALVQFSEPVTSDRINAALSDMDMSATLQEYDQEGNLDFYRIVIPAGTAEVENLSQMLEQGLSAGTQTTVTLESFEMVGPQVGEDMRESALLAMFFALLLITVYISGRFELKWLLSAGIALALAAMIYFLRLANFSIPMLIVAAVAITLVLFWVLNLKYAMGAIVALLHDVIITAGVFSIFGKEFTLPIVAALLTIIGYSLNDTIIVFDRIRENLRRYHRRPFSEIVNRSINETLNRTLLTSGTTLVVVLSLFFLGGGIIHDFAFALMVGICVGTYSSIFVASPILLAWQKRG